VKTKALLTVAQLNLHREAIPKWTLRTRSIRRLYEFRGFLDAIDFVNRVSVKAEKAQHHPDIDVRWNKVTLTLSTHDAGGVTEKDISLARHCDELYARLT
jgi:4a-hydroxytetrahydrobiopterin dehydratase